jgi:phosphatidylinositol 4-kinase
VGLDLYLFPYRIVATAPGCGIIEVVPKSVSRDQMGRSNINNLYQWFLLKYGEENSLQFQKARDAFIKSLAAYSVILYLLQIKDRHNGNVLVDEDGHLVHIDFGFIFDICPGGVKFELSPFKLTKEMVDIMGGPNSPDYKKFVEHCVKAFLATRPYADQICQMVYLMLGSGLPCFKGEMTISRLRSRFQLEMSEKLASQYMISLVESSYRAWSTFIYDGYQKLTNGIPY